MASPPPAVILGATALAFIASAIAFARGRETVGGLLAFIGTLLYGNGIWLLARAVHFDGHYPDAALWWAIGAIVTAHLVKSRAIGIEAGVVAIAWVALETGLFRRPAHLFLGLGAGLVWLAYRTRSAAVLTIAVVSIAAWIAATGVFVWSTTRLLPGTGVVVAVAMVALIVSLLFTRQVRNRSDAAAVAAAGHRQPELGLERVAGRRPGRRVRAIGAAMSGVTLVALLAAVLAVHAWPLWTGQLVYLRVRPVDSRDLLRSDHVALSYLIEDVLLRVPGEPIDTTPPDPAGPPRPPMVDPIGNWWKLDEEQARSWRDREIYLQLQPLPANAPGVAQEHRPVTVSERLVEGAVNLAGRIVFYTTFDYSFRLQFGLDAFAADEPTAKLIDEAMQRDAPIFAEVAVTAAGRARLRALVVDGRRVE